jgi:hypothetical protein
MRSSAASAPSPNALTLCHGGICQVVQNQAVFRPSEFLNEALRERGVQRTYGAGAARPCRARRRGGVVFFGSRLTGCSRPFCHSCVSRGGTHQVAIRSRSQCFAMIAPCQTLKRPHTGWRTDGPRGCAQGVEFEFLCQPVPTDCAGGYTATAGVGSLASRWSRQRPRNLIASFLATAMIARLRPIRGARLAKRSWSSVS